MPAKKRASSAREADKQRTRVALLDAGAALIAEEGVEGPSLDAICERAGYTRGAFYVHFRDRDEFLEAVMERVGAQVLDSLIGDAKDDTTGEAAGLVGMAERFVRAVESGAYPLTKKGGVRPHQLLAACARSPRLRTRYVALIEESIARVAEAIRAAQRAGFLRADVAPKELARLVLAAIIGAHTMLDLEVALDLRKGVRALLTLVAKSG
jgi:AcrR family transcriptional regulator